MSVITSETVPPERTGWAYRDLRGTDQRTPIERRVASLMDLASNWSLQRSDVRQQAAEGLLSHTPTAAALDALSEAAVHAEHADAIRNGSGSWRDLMWDYLSGEDGALTEEQQIVAAYETAECDAGDILRRAVEADANAAARALGGAA